MFRDGAVGKKREDKHRYERNRDDLATDIPQTTPLLMHKPVHKDYAEILQQIYRQQLESSQLIGEPKLLHQGFEQCPNLLESNLLNTMILDRLNAQKAKSSMDRFNDAEDWMFTSKGSSSNSGSGKDFEMSGESSSKTSPKSSNENSSNPTSLYGSNSSPELNNSSAPWN